MVEEHEKKVAVFTEVIEALKWSSPGAISTLRKAIRYESQHGPGWTALDLPAIPRHVKKLVEAGLVKEVSPGRYALVDREAIVEAMNRAWALPRTSVKGIKIDESVFDDVVGYATVKKTLIMALRARKPVHVLLVGPPGYGKSLFLDSVYDYLSTTNQCVNRVEGGKSLTTSLGIIEAVLQMPPDTPCVLIIDELDKLALRELDALYRLMESGEIIITKHNTLVREKRNVWVIAAANDISRIRKYRPAILSRFMVIRIKSLDEEGYKRVVAGILVKRENIEPELAEYIAEKLAPITRDPREAIRIARMSYSKEDVDWLVRALRRSHVAVE